MNPTRTSYVLLGFVFMSALLLLRRRKYNTVKPVKIVAICILLTLCGVAGALIMHYIESGNFSGTSLFGAVLFVPIMMLPISQILRVPYSTLLDMCAPCECIMLAVLKFNCFKAGCCSGRVLTTASGSTIRFPSQLVEMIAFLLIMAVLLKLEKKQETDGKLYPLYLIVYGCTRFILNSFRAGLREFVWIFPPGHFWSIISIIVGVSALIFLKKNKCIRTRQ